MLLVDCVSLSQDGYVPYHSARIEMCHAAAGDNSKKGKVFLEMLNYCLDQIRAPSCEHRLFMRCDVNFDISTQGRNLNTFIGRAAHIEFLESDVFARFIMWSFSDLFRWSFVDTSNYIDTETGFKKCMNGQDFSWSASEHVLQNLLAIHALSGRFLHL